MDQESASALKLAMDKAADLSAFPKEKPDALSLDAKSLDAPENNEIFGKLVSGDEDIIGLVAYSLYKQNKLDWLRAFETRFGRTPNDQEFTAYIIGENTPRRVATYRFLAESTVNRSAAGGGSRVGGDGSGRSAAERDDERLLRPHRSRPRRGAYRIAALRHFRSATAAHDHSAAPA